MPPGNSRLGSAVSIVAIILTGSIVLVLPVLAARMVRALAAAAPAMVAWVVGALVFIGCFVCAEALWRTITWLLAGGRIGAPHEELSTPERRAAELVSRVLQRKNLRVSHVMRCWPSSSHHPDVREARTRLLECADEGADRFDQARLNAQLQALNALMNRLRS
jgi:hypothetical protein